MSHIIIDIASTSIDGADRFIEEPAAPKNYADPVKIAAYIAEKKAERVAEAALDLDLARISCIGTIAHEKNFGITNIVSIQTEADEMHALSELADLLTGGKYGMAPTIVTYNGNSFDLPLLMRRARYLGVPFPKLNLDRYKSPHLDLMAILSDRDPSRRRSLGFYVKRLGWTDIVKPLSGSEEARAPKEGKWDELEASVRHDLVATSRLATWLGVL